MGIIHGRRNTFWACSFKSEVKSFLRAEVYHKCYESSITTQWRLNIDNFCTQKSPSMVGGDCRIPLSYTPSFY